LAEHCQKASRTRLESPQEALAEPAPPAEIRQPAVTEVPPAQQQLREAA
jgi:hypothetical protein